MSFKLRVYQFYILIFINFSLNFTTFIKDFFFIIVVV